MSDDETDKCLCVCPFNHNHERQSSRDNRYFIHLSEHVGVLGTGIVRQESLIGDSFSFEISFITTF